MLTEQQNIAKSCTRFALNLLSVYEKDFSLFTDLLTDTVAGLILLTLPLIEVF